MFTGAPADNTPSMKSLSFLILFLFWHLVPIAQVTTPSDYDEVTQHPSAGYSAWQTIYQQNNPNVWVKIQFSVAGCRRLPGDKNHFSETVRSYWQILNDYQMDNVVHFKFDYRNCSNQVITKQVSFSLKQAGTDAQWWYYFYASEIVRGPYDVSFNDPDKLKPPSATDDKLDAAKKRTDQLINNPDKQYPKVKPFGNAMGDRADNTPTTGGQVETLAMTTTPQPDQQQEQLQAQRRQQLALLDSKMEIQAQKLTAVNDAISGLADLIISNMLQKSIASDTRDREQRFTELREEVNSKHGSLVDCSECNGQGYSSCDKCNSRGYIVCSQCDGNGKKRCYHCNGTGVSLGARCVICNGTGYETCTSCFGKGKSVCTACYGLGRQQCIHCRGTGKEFKED